MRVTKKQISHPRYINPNIKASHATKSQEHHADKNQDQV